VSEIFSIVKEHSLRSPDKTAIVEVDGNSLTYSQLIALVDRRAKQLRFSIKLGLTHVGLCVSEGIELAISVLALNSLNVPVVPLNPTLRSDQIITLLASTDVDVLIAESRNAQLLAEADVGFKILDLDLLSSASDNENPSFKPLGDSSEYDNFLITLSSGSTGHSKPIVFSEKNKLARFEQAVQLFGVTSEDVVLCASPFFHSLGQRLTLLPLLAGATLVQLTRFSAKKWCEAVTANRVTFTIPVSSHLHELVDALLSSKGELSSLRCLVSSSAAIDDGVKKNLFSTLHCEFYEMYGASEVATVTSLSREQADSKPTSVGLSCPGVDIRVVREDHSVCRPLEVGEITVKSPLASAGYYKLPARTKASFVKGYFHTEDLGYLDDDGYLYFVDRKKDIIISGGVNIYPSDIEEVINEHESVVDCVVLGINDRYLGEALVAVLASSEAWPALRKDIKTLVRVRLAPFQRPLKYFLRETFPLTASGKVDKASLRKELNALQLDLSSKMRSLLSG